MLKKTKKEKKQVHSICDIETKKDGGLLAIGLYNDTMQKVKHFYTWEDFLYFLEDNNENAYYQKILAHNGGGFDWVHLFTWLFMESKLPKDKIEIIMTGSSIIFASLDQFNNKVVFCDTLLVLKSSLDALCKVFNPGVAKLKNFPIDRIEEIFNNDPEMFFKYLDNDCISLFEITRQFQALLEIDFFPVTIASLGMYIFKKEYLSKDYKIFKPDSVQDDFITDSYAGGRVECFRQGIFKKIYTYDLNSLYPFIMESAQIPICTPQQTKTFMPGVTGFYRIKFNQTNKKVPPVLWSKSNKKGLEFTYQGKGTFSNHEIELALKMGTEIKFLFGYVYLETAPIFKKYVNHFYELRLTYAKSDPMNLIAKYLLNCLYGKWGQKELTEKMVSLTPVEYVKMITDMIPIKDYDAAKGLYILSEERHIPHRIVFIASIITALARCEIYKYINKYVNDIVYCDTDSIHLTCKMGYNIGTKLGQMKAEESGEAVYIGRKMYGIDDPNEKKQKITFKGLTTKGKLPHDTLTLDDMKIIYYQTKEQEQNRENCYKYSFATFPKFKTVLQGRGVAAKMQTITKVLKKPEYTTNFLKENY